MDVFTSPLLSGLLGDDAFAEFFTPEAELAAMVKTEIAIAKVQGQMGIITPEAAQDIAAKLSEFSADIAALNAATARDGLVVPNLVAQMRAAIGAPHDASLHHGATSQDIVDTALVLRLKTITQILDARLKTIIVSLETLGSTHGQNALMGRTRMQAALPITVQDRIDTWRLPLIGHRQRLAEITPRLLQVQFGGPVGDLAKLGVNGPNFVQQLAEELGLTTPQKSWHAMRETLAEFASWLSLVCGVLGKMGQDIALMAQNEIAEITLSGGGGSSAMPHKQNPIMAETLVTLARFNATQVSGMHHALIHEQERSGSAWALEWMILPQMILATGAATRTADTLLGAVQNIGVISAR